MLSEQVQKMLNVGALNSVFSSVFSVAGSVAVAAVSISFIAFYFMKEEGLFLKILLAVAPARYADNVTRAVDKITKMLSRYFLGVLGQSTVMMLIISVVLMCFGFRPQDAFFVGVIEGVFNIIPYVGPWVGFILSALAGLTFSTTTTMGLVYVLVVIACTILVAQAVDNYLISPRVFSHQVNAHPLEIFIVTLVAGSCMGIFGMLVAIPAYTVLRVLAKEFLYNYKLVRKLTENV
jgi:predicted PurR-regulated permease PerM